MLKVGLEQDYNDIARKLQLIPTTAKRACGQQFEGRASKNGTSATEIVNVDFKVISHAR